ncbi:MAG: hypothetical protein KGY50_04000 [Candidatus Thermoplasmatota archaeon]|nr:hypothetical protein [Candidatus Thermoplasmatota archaeon]
MQQVNIGIFHDDSLAKSLGKKATESDMVLFHRKTDDQIFTFAYSVEDKIIPKSQIINMIDVAIISAEEITPALGETILMLDSVGINKGIIITQPYADNTQLEKMIQGTTLSSFHMMTRDVHQIMEILQKQTITKEDDAPVAVTIDHSFHVKGVGDVILGFINQGIVRKHDKLMLHPLDKQITVRSIQMQDNDVEAASGGSRVGLAVKGASVDDLNRGYILSNPESTLTSQECKLSFNQNPFYPNVSVGKYHVTVGLQTVPIEISEIKDSSIIITTDKPISYLSHQHFLFLDLNAEKLHHMGTGKLR